MYMIRGISRTPIDGQAAEEAAASLPEPEILDLVVRAFQTLGDPTRARILYALASRPLCVRDLATIVGVSESAVSHQLRLLRERRVVKGVRRGHNQVEYRLDDHHVAALFKEAEYHADHVRRDLEDHPYPGAEQDPI
jgi:ArsR family transcriptional regulator, lead/cadmium/zinc/bismuth-responsive transcriptional repressor